MNFVLKGDLCYSKDRQTLATLPDGYLVCENGISQGVFPTLPQQYAHLPLLDYSGKLVIPGLTDLHLHAPQYAFRGLGMDLELLEWLDANVFPEEARYADLDYAQAAYRRFVDGLKRGPNTRACVFATVHVGATQVLMDLLEESGLVTYVGKVNMDRNCPQALQEQGVEQTVKWLESVAGRYRRTRPILSPRFTPSCTDDLMARLGDLQKQYDLPVQSHLSENQGEVAWVKQLCPWSKHYGDAYDRFGLFGDKTIMAHCVLSGEEEVQLMQKNGVFLAHCPQSNTNLASGIAPARRYLDLGLNMGLGSDVAGGVHTSILRAMADAIQVSKLRWRLQDEGQKPLTVPEAFWLGTLGGGAFFGQVGSFAPGYELDAVVLEDEAGGLTIPQRLERAVYLSEDRDVSAKFVQGIKIAD